MKGILKNVVLGGVFLFISLHPNGVNAKNNLGISETNISQRNQGARKCGQSVGQSQTDKLHIFGMYALHARHMLVRAGRPDRGARFGAEKPIQKRNKRSRKDGAGYKRTEIFSRTR